MASITKSGWKDFDIAIANIKLGLDAHARAKGKTWAANVADFMYENVPINTGNLRDAITDLEVTPGQRYIAGVSEKALLAAAGTHKRSVVTNRKRKIPNYNYIYKAGPAHNAYLPDITRDLGLRGFIKNLWFEQAKIEIERLF